MREAAAFGGELLIERRHCRAAAGTAVGFADVDPRHGDAGVYEPIVQPSLVPGGLDSLVGRAIMTQGCGPARQLLRR